MNTEAASSSRLTTNSPQRPQRSMGHPATDLMSTHLSINSAHNEYRFPSSSVRSELPILSPTLSSSKALDLHRKQTKKDVPPQRQLNPAAGIKAYEVKRGVLSDGRTTANHPAVHAFLDSVEALACDAELEGIEENRKEALARLRAIVLPRNSSVYALAALACFLHPMHPAHWVFWGKQKEMSAQIVHLVLCTVLPCPIESPIAWSSVEDSLWMLGSIQAPARRILAAGAPRRVLRHSATASSSRRPPLVARTSSSTSCGSSKSWFEALNPETKEVRSAKSRGSTATTRMSLRKRKAPVTRMEAISDDEDDSPASSRVQEAGPSKRTKSSLSDTRTHATPPPTVLITVTPPPTLAAPSLDAFTFTPPITLPSPPASRARSLSPVATAASPTESCFTMIEASPALATVKQRGRSTSNASLGTAVDQLTPSTTKAELDDDVLEVEAKEARRTSSRRSVKPAAADEAVGVVARREKTPGPGPSRTKKTVIGRMKPYSSAPSSMEKATGPEVIMEAPPKKKLGRPRKIKVDVVEA